MTREWKPGDVATWGAAMGRTVVGMMDRSGHWNGVDAYGDTYTKRKRVSPRPLLVIDPEDLEQVERLTVAVMGSMAVHFGDVPKMQAALREFANPKPPKPDEPTGLGAVVEGREGNRWIRTERTLVHPWQHVGPVDRVATWEGVCAYLPVEVLSEGVTP